MAKFSLSVEEDGEGTSSWRHKRQRTSSQHDFVDIGSEDSQEHQQEEEQQAEEEEEEEEEEDVIYEEDEEEESVSEGEEEEVEEENEEEAHDQEQDHQGGTVGPRSNSGTLDGRDGSISVTLTDPEVLDCCICYEPLSIPVFQCENGHIACSSCCIKLKNKCPSCSWPIGYNRCRAIEKVLDAVKISCQNTKYGCKEAVSYSKKNDHEKTCIYAPCSCPLSHCNFVASSKQLYLHFSSKHTNSAVRFMYNTMFYVSLSVNDKFLVLQEQNDGALFILNNLVELLGNVVTISCIGPCSLKEGFFYDLLAKTQGSSLRLQSFTKNSQLRGDKSPSTGFLLIPSDFFGSVGRLKLEVNIQQNAACSAYACRNIGLV